VQERTFKLTGLIVTGYSDFKLLDSGLPCLLINNDNKRKIPLKASEETGPDKNVDIYQ
jgi:hypothetical protein